MKGARFDHVMTRLSRFGAAVVLVISFAFMLFLTVFACLETGDVSTNNAAGELVELYADNIFLNALALFILVSTLYLLYRHSSDFSLWWTELVMMAAPSVMAALTVAVLTF